MVSYPKSGQFGRALPDVLPEELVEHRRERCRGHLVRLAVEHPMLGARHHRGDPLCAASIAGCPLLPAIASEGAPMRASTSAGTSKSLITFVS